MHKAGGIIGLIAGLLAVGAALFTLLMGGAGAALDAAGHDRIIAYGRWGVGAAFMVIAFSAVAIFNAAVGGFGLLAFSIVGAVLGGSIVAIVLSLALLGGILAAAGSKKWWPWAGVLAGIAMVTPIALEMGDPRKDSPPAAVVPENPPPPQSGTASELPRIENTSPSFDCAKARSNVEIMICNSPTLSSADATMAQLHKAARLKTDDVWAFDAIWQEWLMLRDGCTTDACLDASYTERIADLRQKSP
jgi:hypothetical protein